MSAAYGVGGLTDGYFLAFATAVFVASIANVAVESNTLPAAFDARRLGRRGIFRFAARTSVQVVVACVAVYVVVAAITLHVSLPSDADGAAVMRACAWWFGVYVAATAACSVVTACMYSHQRFFAPPASGSARAITAILALLVLSPTQPTLPLLAAAWAGGEVLRLVVLSAMLYRCATPNDDGGSAPRSVWRPLITHALSMCVVGAVPLIDRAFAATLTPGSVTVLELGEKVLFVPVLIFTSSVTVVAGTRWAEAAGSGLDPRPDARRVFRSLAISSSVIAAGVMAAALTMSLSVDRFLGADSGLLAGVIAALSLGLPTAVLINATIRFLTATGRTGALPLFAVVTLVGNTGLDAVGVALFGLPGIAIATSLTRAVSFGLYARYVFGAPPAAPADDAGAASAMVGSPLVRVAKASTDSSTSTL